MKKFLTVFAFAMGLLLAGNAGAQMKAGYISVDNMVGLMPETAKIDTYWNATRPIQSILSMRR